MKPMFVVSCPIDTYSGYGARSRDFVKALIELDKYNVKILPQRWGITPWGFIEDHPEWEFLTKYYLDSPQLSKQPEIWCQITVPNEFQSIGKFNIGLTAGIETTICHASWIEGLNRMDLNLVSSEHAKRVFQNAKFEKRDSRNNQIIDIIELKKPIEILFEGADIDIYKSIPKEEIKFINLDEVKESFAYLFVGHWMQGNLGEDRKNVGLLVKAFYETFKNQPTTPALILKTSAAGASYMDRENILDRIRIIKNTVKANTLPNVYLLHGEFTDNEMNELYNHPKVKAMVSLTKGEGFGRPLLEFSLTKKPIITTNWSGHLDFLHKNFNILLGGELKNVDSSAAIQDMILTESQWFNVNLIEVNNALTDLYKNYKNHIENGKKQAARSKNHFSYEQMKNLLDITLKNHLPIFPQEVQLKLPELELL